VNINHRSNPLMEKNGWQLFKDGEGGFWVLCMSGAFGGFTTNEEDAKSLLLEKSGAIEEAFPPVKDNDVKVLKGQKLQGPGYWYRLDHFYLNGKEIGQVQIKEQGTKVITKVKDKACIGYDLKWMLRENGFRLVV